MLERATGRVLVTSQNHGFAVAAGDGDAATHESLYDGTVEGLAYPELRAALGAVPPRGAARARTTPARSSTRWVEEVRAAAA